MGQVLCPPLSDGDWEGLVFHWWFIKQVVWVPLNSVEKPLVVLSQGLLLCIFAHWQLPCIILHRFDTTNIRLLSFKLVSKAVDFWRLGVNILLDLLVSFLTNMVHCMPGSAFGCIVWCPSAFTSLPSLESFPLGSNDVVPDILSGSISYTCRRTHMQFEDLEMIACLAVPSRPTWPFQSPHGIRNSDVPSQGHILEKKCESFASKFLRSLNF